MKQILVGFNALVFGYSLGFQYISKVHKFGNNREYVVYKAYLKRGFAYLMN